MMVFFITFENFQNTFVSLQKKTASVAMVFFHTDKISAKNAAFDWIEYCIVKAFFSYSFYNQS